MVCTRSKSSTVKVRSIRWVVSGYCGNQLGVVIISVNHLCNASACSVDVFELCGTEEDSSTKSTNIYCQCIYTTPGILTHGTRVVHRERVSEE